MAMMPCAYCTGTDTLDKLCEYFDCELVELAEYVREVPTPVKPAEKRSGKGAAGAESKGTGRKPARTA